MKNKIKQSFEKGANFYDALNDIQNKSLNELIKFMEITIPNQFLVNKSIKVLDLGCGTSELTKKLSNKYSFLNCKLLDISTKMINISKQKLKKFNFNYQTQDFDTFQKFGFFDLIYSNMSLHWSANFSKLVNRIISDMKPKSFFCFSFPNSKSFKNFINELSKKDIQLIMNNLPSKNCFQQIYELRWVKIKTKETIIKKKILSPLSFLRELRLMGAGTSLNIRRNNLFKIRNMQKELFEVDFNISFFIIKKL